MLVKELRDAGADLWLQTSVVDVSHGSDGLPCGWNAKANP